MALAPLLIVLAAPADGDVTPDGDMLGELELGVVALGLMLGVVMLGVVTLGAVAFAAVSVLVDGIAGVAGVAGLAGVADGSLTLPLDVVVVAPVLFFDVSLCVVLVLGWLVVTCAAAGIANAASITAAGPAIAQPHAVGR